MWTERHRTRHEARLKDRVVQAGLDEMARLVERADQTRRPLPPVITSKRRGSNLCSSPDTSRSPHQTTDISIMPHHA